MAQNKGKPTPELGTIKVPATPTVAKAEKPILPNPELPKLKADMETTWKGYEKAWGEVEAAGKTVETAKEAADKAVIASKTVYDAYKTAKKAFTDAGGVVEKEAA